MNEEFFQGIKDGIDDGIAEVKNYITPTTAAIAGGALVSSVVAGTIISRSTKTKKKRRKTTKKSKSKRRRTTKKGKRRTPYTAGKRKDRSTKRIRYTKNGQPYVIQANGRARFISHSSAKNSRRRKGGRY